jgi:Recombination endonuclease VII.
MSDRANYMKSYRDQRIANPYQHSGECRVCNVALGRENWSLSSYASRDYICRECSKKKCGHYYDENKEVLGKRARAKEYSITLGALEEMEQEQRGLCKICGGVDTHQSLSIDHDHSTGKVRGLLCSACNIGLGYFRDDPVLLEMAASYLRESL